MASSSIAVVGRDSQRTVQSQESSTSLTDLDSDLSSYQNMEDASPGTIIFSPQDLRPLTVKKAGGGNSSAANVADSNSTVAGYNSGSSNFHSSNPTLHSRATAKSSASSNRERTPQISMSEMTQAERKAEDIATSIEKLKDIEGPVACQFCGKVMLSGKTLVQHMSIHAEYKPFQCPHCPKSFTRKVQLQGHLVVHGIEKQFECPVCHQRFSRRDCVKVHMRIHDKTKCAFCEVCHKSFLTMGALNIHMRIHRGEKPFKCHLCGKCFTQKNHLITHIKRHTNVQDVHFAKKLGPRMFQCEHCDRSFIRLSDYERHVQWNHGAVADVNNLPTSSIPSTIATEGEEGPVRAPRDVVRERSKLYKKPKKEAVVMCTSATQTDDSGGHIIIPRQYRQQYELEQQQKAAAAPSEPSDTPRHIDEDTYDAYDEGMDRNYSSDDDDADVSEENQPHQRIFNIDSTSITAPTSSDPARDAAFDAIINSTNETSPNKNKLNNPLEEAEHILPDSLDADQPNERVFIIQNENDSYEPTVTAGDYSNNASLRASEVISSTVSATTSSSTTNKGASNSFFTSTHRPHKDANNTASEPQQTTDGRRIPDLNSQLDSDNFMELVQNSYQSLAKGVPGTITSSVPGRSAMTGQDMTGIGGGGVRSMSAMPFVGAPPKNVAPLPQVFKSRRGRPKTKKMGIKGAAQLRLIRKSMMSFISDVEEKKEACRSAGIPEGMPGEEEGMEDDALSAEECEDGDPRSALERQVMMGVDDLQAGANRPQRKRPLIKHGEDFLCASKTCALCRPNLKNAGDKGRDMGLMPAPGTLVRAQIKTETKNVVVKKEQNLSQLAKKGSRKVAEIVNLLEFGVKDLDELEIPSQQSLSASSVYNNSGPQKSALPFRPKMTDLSNNNADEVYLAKTSVGDSIVSPPVDVQSFCIPTYSCKLCGREFRFEGKLHRHIESVHQKKNIFTSDVRPGRGTKTQFIGYPTTSTDLEGGAGSSSNTMIVSSLNSDMSAREQVHLSHHGDETTRGSEASDGEMEASPAKQETIKVKNPEIEALRSEWDDDDNEDEDQDDAEVRPTVTKPQPIFKATPLQQPHPASPDKQQQFQQQHLQRQQQSHTSGINFASDSMAMPIVTRDIQPMVTTVTDVYSGGVVVNMNKLTGLLPKTESKLDQESDLGQGSGMAQTTTVAANSLESNSLDSKCQKLLLKLFDRQLLVQCGLEEDHVSAVLGRVLQHYGVKMIEDYGQGQYEVLKYNLWRLMEWKVTIEQMEEFYSENKTVEEMMDDIMNERVPLVPHEVITQARAQEQQQQAARQLQQQQQVEEMVVPRMMDGSDHLVVEQQVEGEQVVMQGTEHMIVDQGSGQHIVVQGMDQNGQQIMLQNISDGGLHDGHHHPQQIVLQQSQELSHDTAMLVQQVMSGHPQLAGVTQVVVAQDLSPEMLQGAHIVTIDPATGQVLSQVSADQVVLATHDGTIMSGSGQGGGGGTVVSLSGQQQHHQEAIVVSQEQMMMLQQQYNSQQQQQQSSGSTP